MQQPAALIVEGYGVHAPRFAGITVYATHVTTKALQVVTRTEQTAALVNAEMARMVRCLRPLYYIEVLSVLKTAPSFRNRDVLCCIYANVGAVRTPARCSRKLLQQDEQQDTSTRPSWYHEPDLFFVLHMLPPGPPQRECCNTLP